MKTPGPVEWERYAEMMDAARFEASVAELLCNPDGIDTLCPCWDNADENLPCEGRELMTSQWCRLRAARLAAEREIDG